MSQWVDDNTVFHRNVLAAAGSGRTAVHRLCIHINLKGNA